MIATSRNTKFQQHHLLVTCSHETILIVAIVSAQISKEPLRVNYILITDCNHGGILSGTLDSLLCASDLEDRGHLLSNVVHSLAYTESSSRVIGTFTSLNPLNSC